MTWTLERSSSAEWAPFRRTAAWTSAGRGSAPRLGLAYRFSDKWVARAGYGLTNDPYYGMELIRANYPILNQLKLESPDKLTPAATLSQGLPAVQVPAEGERRPGHPKRLCVAGLPQETRSGIHPVLELHRAAGAAVGFHGTGGLRRHSHHAAARTPRHQCRPGHRRWRGRRPLLTKFGRTASTVLLQPIGDGKYDSMQLQLQRRFLDGLSLGVNYTLGRAISPNENSSLPVGDHGVQALPYMEPQSRVHEQRSTAQRRHHERLADSRRSRTGGG